MTEKYIEMEAKDLLRRYSEGERDFRRVKLPIYLCGSALYGLSHTEATDIHCADLMGVDFREADLRGADLRETDLRGADLREARLGTIENVYPAERPPSIIAGIIRIAGPKKIEYVKSFHVTDLGRTDLRGADLRGIEFTHPRGLEFAIFGEHKGRKTIVSPKELKVIEAARRERDDFDVGGI